MLSKSVLLLTLVAGVLSVDPPVLDCSKHVELCKADCWHRNCVIPTRNPNSRGTGRAQLTKVDDATTDQHRTASGYKTPAAATKPCLTSDTGEPGPWSRSDIKGFVFGSIEEYPFASTAEGGAGSSLRCVTRSANSIQGGEISGINVGNTYTVRLSNTQNVATGIDGNGVNYGGVDWCQPETGGTSTCENDGRQFYWDATQQDYFLDQRTAFYTRKRAVVFGNPPALAPTVLEDVIVEV